MADTKHYTELGLVNTRDLFKGAMEGGYAIPAYNFNNMEQLQGILLGCAESKSPVILQVSGSARKYANQTFLPYMAMGAVQMVEEMAALGPLDGVSRIDPLPWRQGEYFMARSYEAIGDTASAIEVYEDLVVGFGDAVARIPLMADAPERLEALRAGGGGSAEAVPTDGSTGGSTGG